MTGSGTSADPPSDDGHGTRLDRAPGNLLDWSDAIRG
jgi:hypothetical protein